MAILENRDSFLPFSRHGKNPVLLAFGNGQNYALESEKGSSENRKQINKEFRYMNICFVIRKQKVIQK